MTGVVMGISSNLFLFRELFIFSHIILSRHLEFVRLSPKSSANPIAVTPIWKREFANGKYPIGGLYRILFEISFFKSPFSYKRFQMGQKIFFFELYKL